VRNGEARPQRDEIYAEETSSGGREADGLLERSVGRELRGLADDGVGFRPAAVRESAPGHLGLSSMRERVEAAGGSLSIDSAPGRGTVVACFVPMTDSGIARQELARRDHRDGSAIIGASRARRA
jgi:signal transduction histidine kinase